MPEYNFQRRRWVGIWEYIEGSLTADNIEDAIHNAKDDDHYDDSVESRFIYETQETLTEEVKGVQVPVDYIHSCVEI